MTNRDDDYTEAGVNAMADATEALETGVPPGTTLIEAGKIGIEVDTEPGYDGFLILDLDGERFELEMNGRLRSRLADALERSGRYANEAQRRAAQQG
jgi:hypothetical protein